MGGLAATYGRNVWLATACVCLDDQFVETPEANLSTGMQFLNGSYASYFNRRHRRAGHLFQGRFKGQLIEEEGYFLVVSRYIHVNPMRAGMVDRPEDYRISSYPGYHYKRKMVPWITYDAVLREFFSDENQARSAICYRP